MTTTTTNPYENLSYEELFALADKIGSKYQEDDEIPDWEKEAIALAVDEEVDSMGYLTKVNDYHVVVEYVDGTHADYYMPTEAEAIRYVMSVQSRGYDDVQDVYLVR